jgi:flagellar hook assembly protein FlgD
VAPNPISKEAIIRFDLPTQTAVQIHVYDARGRLVLSALEGEQFPAGRHQWVWDGRSRSGNRVPPGIYFYRLIAGSFTATRKAVLME